MNPEIRCSIEFRADESRQSPGRLVGNLITYETRAVDRPEIFVTDSLYWDDGGIILNEQHNRQAPIIRFTPEKRGNELVVDIALPDTQRGRDAAISVRNGTMQGLSVEFHSESEGRRNGMREIRKARLVGAGLVDSASYGNSIEVRHKEGRRLRVWL